MKSIVKMSKSLHKLKKLTTNLPDDMVEHIMSMFLPIQSVLRNRSVSKKFKDANILSRDLDFSGIFSERLDQLEAVSIIESIFNQHKGSEISRFVLLLDHFDMEDKILSWIQTCIGKNIQELVLDFSSSKCIIEIPVDFSAIETLTVLRLRWCEFDIPGNSPKGLKLLRTLELVKSVVTKEMIEAIFNNCIHLETLELIKCLMYGVLNINAKNHKKFKSLVVYSMPNILDIILDAPTLECYKYDGFIRYVDFSRVDALKEAKLHYGWSYDWGCYSSLSEVRANIVDFTKVHFLATTDIFVEAIPSTLIMEKMRKMTFIFWNLQEFHILFKAPTACTFDHIIEFLEHCPNLERLLININDFTFETEFDWEPHQNYQLNSIREVKINGYKGHWHELDILHFFLWNAQSLEELILVTHRKLSEYDHARINQKKILSPKKALVKVIEC